MGKKFILLALVLTLSPLITPIVMVGQVNDSISGIELKYRTPYSLPQGWIYVLVEASVFDGINFSLNRYATDLESIDGFSVGIYTVSTSNTTAIRSLLQQALPEGLVGCLLVGDIPEAYRQYGPSEYWSSNTFPTDFYYMDLDGVWNDTNSDGAYDEHSGETSAEIWVGRLQPSSVDGDDIWLLNNYFEKNHLYRTGKLTLPKRALVYADVWWGEEWANLTRIAYDETLLVNDPKITNASDYRERLVEGYEWISLECHGSPGSHTFLSGYAPPEEWDGTLTGLDYREIDPHTFFYVFDVCHAASWRVRNNLVSSVVFTNTSGLLAIGPKDLDHKWGPNAEFYEALSDGKSIGEAYLEDIKSQRISEYTIYEYWWMMAGDPSLPINGYPRYELTVTSSPITGVTFTVGSVSRTAPWSGTYSKGTSVSLVMPETHDGYIWSHWLAYMSWYGPFEDGDTNRTKTVTMDTDITLTAVFTPDTAPPAISIVSPENKTYLVNDIPLNFTVSESTSWIGYSLDGQMNVTITGNTTLSGLPDGSHILIVYANDTAGNTGASEIIYFSIETQQAEPLQMWIVAAIVMITGVGAALMVYFAKVKKTTEKIE